MRLEAREGAPRSRAGGPGPLEIEAAEMPGDVDHFSDEIEPRNVAALHGPRAQLRCVDSARGDLGLFVAFGSRRIDGPAVESGLCAGEALVGPCSRRLYRQPAICQSMRKYGVECGAGAGEIALRYLGAQRFGPEAARRKVYRHRLAGVPVRRDL